MGTLNLAVPLVLFNNRSTRFPLYSSSPHIHHSYITPNHIHTHILDMFSYLQIHNILYCGPLRLCRDVQWVTLLPLSIVNCTLNATNLVLLKHVPPVLTGIFSSDSQLSENTLVSGGDFTNVSMRS